MKTQIIFILFAFSIIAFAQQPNRTNNNPTSMSPQLLERLTQSVLLIETSSLYGTGGGSGFIIGSNGLCVTNHHVLDNAYDGTVKMKNGKRYNIRSVIGFDAKSDLAVFQLDVPRDQKLPAVRIANGLARPGENSVYVGAPYGFEQSIFFGNVVQLRKANIGYDIQFNMSISNGSSGSPIFNMRGEVIGVVARSKLVNQMGPVAQNLNFGPSSVTLMELLQKSKGKRPIALFDMSDDPLVTRNVKLARFARRSDINESIKIINIELQNNPKNYVAYELLGSIFYDIGHYSEGADAYLKANKISPRNDNLAGYAINRSAAARNSGNKDLFKEAYRYLNESVRQKPDPALYNEMALLLLDFTITYKYLNPNQLANALDAATLAYETKGMPTLFRFLPGWGLITRGNIKEALNEHDDALGDYELAIKDEPDDYQGYMARGTLLALHFKDFIGGVKDLSMALKLSGNQNKYRNAIILYHQAVVYEKWYDSSGEGAHLQTAIKKLDQAYSLTQEEAFLSEKQRMIAKTYNNSDDGEEIFFDDF